MPTINQLIKKGIFGQDLLPVGFPSVRDPLIDRRECSGNPRQGQRPLHFIQRHRNQSTSQLAMTFW